ELVEAHSQNEELTSLADEAQSLKDEMDMLRHSSDKVSKLEGTVEYYKKKLEDANRCRNELETENRLINQHVIEGQGQVEELQKDLQEQGLKADDSAMLKKKNQEYMDKLRELNDELLKKKNNMLIPRGSGQQSLIQDFGLQLASERPQDRLLSRAGTDRGNQQQQQQIQIQIQNYLHKVNAECEKPQSAKQELQNQLLALQTQLEQLQEETFRLEAAKDDSAARSWCRSWWRRTPRTRS
ncbi:hypothetical protein CRUP_014693, partial [Coryphaenoides rupestris]